MFFLLIHFWFHASMVRERILYHFSPYIFAEISFVAPRLILVNVSYVFEKNVYFSIIK